MCQIWFYKTWILVLFLAKSYDYTLKCHKLNLLVFPDIKGCVQGSSLVWKRADMKYLQQQLLILSQYLSFIFKTFDLILYSCYNSHDAAVASAVWHYMFTAEGTILKNNLLIYNQFWWSKFQFKSKWFLKYQTFMI